MKELNASEIKKIMVGILGFTKSVCDEYSIKYYLAYGSCLGAVRHGGMIPWDDDIDIYMTRADFEKFYKIANRRDDGYEVLHVGDTGGYTLPLAKIIDKRTYLRQIWQRENYKLGVYADIFILDNVPDDASERKRFFKKLHIYQRFWFCAQSKEILGTKRLPKIAKKIIQLPFLLIGPEYFAKKTDRLARKYNGAETKCIGSMSFSFYGRKKEVFDKNIFGNGIKMRFESLECIIPEKYDEYLTSLYGDYMTPPPENKRVSNHDSIAYLKSGK